MVASSFAKRHIGPTQEEQARMLAYLGARDLDDLIYQAMPAQLRFTGSLALEEATTEAGLLAELSALAAQNNPLRAMIGLGYHGTVTPPVIRRNILENPAWYTAYTPYQPEISQGRLEALLNFQTMIGDLTGLSICGASLLDEATALAEAVRLAHRQTRRSGVVVVDAGILPQSLGVLRTHLATLDATVVVAADVSTAIAEHEPFAVVVQTPRADGQLWDVAELREIADTAHAKGALVIAAVDLLALTLTTPPGEWGADIAVGSSQRFGVPLFYGGPHAGFMSVRSGLERGLPGRLVGVSIDADARPGFRLALQTREQHIRRERATSNICTAQVLLAVVASMYAVYHGPQGLRGIASDIHQRARSLAGALIAGGYELAGNRFFDTLTVSVDDGAAVVAGAKAAGVHLRLVDATHVGVAIGEDATEADLAALLQVFQVGAAESVGSFGEARTSTFCTHPVFNSHHSEIELVRYMRALAERDFALDRGMIPLGSCTMKLNATAELEPISYPGFANLHPFVPAEDATGYAILIERLERWLAEITGYDAVSLQPNAGSQGEYAGLMAIRSYHRANGEQQRVVCLIPASAHGTNAASAVMAGMQVVVVKTAHDGSIDLDDFAAKIEKHANELAAIMVTYPSTHGVFEEGIVALCQAVHDAGGQVYIDGANMNALVGLGRPRDFGADVSHLNLHKTFAIPHGGGGPGVGPIGVRAHLAPYLPSHPVVANAGPETSYGPVSAAPYGSPGVLPISYGYIALMGADGLTQATRVALLSANYVAKRLQEYYPVLYSGRGGLVAHECILDLRQLSKQSGITVEDVAKRLIDYGFHAPTLSFPVAGTLMVEPTESEPLVELDRFCDAMIAIRAEIDKVSRGEWSKDDNPLVNSPHPADRLLGKWEAGYSRNCAAYGSEQPTFERTRNKFWPVVGRIDGAYGDRNLACSCPGESFQTPAAT